MCAWLRLWINEDDDPAFMRAATTPRRGIGHQTLAALGEFASRARLSLFGALFAHSLPAALPARAVAALHEFGRLVSRQQEQARHAVGHGAARQLVSEWLQDIAYEKHLLDSADSKEQAAARWHNVQEFCDWMAARCGGQAGDETGAGARAESSLLDVAQIGRAHV